MNAPYFDDDVRKKVSTSLIAVTPAILKLWPTQILRVCSGNIHKWFLNLGGSWNSDSTNKGSVNRIWTRWREGVKKDPQNSDIIYGCSLWESARDRKRVYESKLALPREIWKYVKGALKKSSIKTICTYRVRAIKGRGFYSEIIFLIYALWYIWPKFMTNFI